MFLNSKPEAFQNGYKMVKLSGKIARYKIFVNVGGAEMAFNGGDERIAFGTMAKGQKKYGATSSRHKRNEQVVVYNVQRGDTLPGIAIKFGVTTEQIRRANNLWTNDSLFLRDKLLIPVNINSQEDENSKKDGLSQDNMEFGNNLSSPLGENGSFKMLPHWSHPLCDSFESEDCIVSPSPVHLDNSNLGLDHSTGGNSSTWCSSKDSSLIHIQIDSSSTLNGSNGAISNGTHNSHQLKNSKYHSVDDGSSYQHSSNEFFPSSTNPGTPTSPASSSSSRRRSVVDHSEKSAEEFLSRIDTAIASNKMQAINKSEQDKTPWVTFDSDSESDHRHSSGTSITSQGRHLRYSLRKLEKAQEELFQL